jgi:Putative transposase
VLTVAAGDGRTLEALARYCLRNPVSLARLRWVPGSETATYLPRAGHDGERAETLDALDFVARLLAHVPDPRRHLVYYYGAYSNVVRGKLKALNQARPTTRPSKQSLSPRDRAFILRHRLPARPPRRPLFGADGPGF